MNKTNPKVDEYIETVDQWKEELIRIRSIVLDCGLKEEFKWRQPCYTHQKGNIVILGGFKAYYSINFFKGALLKDPHGMLVTPGKNTQASRQLQFTSVAEIEEKEELIRAYIQEAIEVERSGAKIKYKAKSEYAIPAELQIKFDENPALQAAFEALTPGRQKGYLLHFGGAKQSKSRTARVEKYTQRILDGYGMQDCVCGLSKRMPTCDGSHKQLEQ